MLETMFRGSRKYWGFVLFLLGIIAVGVIAWLREHELGSGLTTGLTRDVPWGSSVGQLTFFVGVAASAAMVVLPHYIHDYKAFGRITVLGEFLAVSAVVISMLSVFSIMGRPERILYVLLHPTPRSIIFWDMIVLSIYLILNIVCGYTVLNAERRGIPAPKWIKPFIYWAILWAPTIHMVTAFLYAGLPGKHHFMTALQAVHFLATAFAAGPSLLIVLCLILKKVSRFDPGTKAIRKLAEIAVYSLLLHLLFIGLEFFTAFYSQNPSHMRTLQYLYFGLDGKLGLAPMMWTSLGLASVGLVLLAVPAARRNERTLGIGAVLVFFAVWIDKGFAFVVGGFVPNSFERIVDYLPHFNEILISAGVWAIGILVLTVLCKMVIAVKEEAVFDQYGDLQVKDKNVTEEFAECKNR